MGRYADSHSVCGIWLAALETGKWCLWGCIAHCWWKEHRVLPSRWQRNLTGAGCGPDHHPHVEAAARCCSWHNEAVDHQIFQCVLWESVCTHTNGPWKRDFSRRNEHNILPVCFTQQADLPFKGKCLLPLRHFLSVAITFFKRKMEGFFPPFFPRHLHFSFSHLILQYFSFFLPKSNCWRNFFCKLSLWEIKNYYQYLGKKKSRLFCTFL